MAEKKQANSKAQKLQKEFTERFEKTLRELHEWAKGHDETVSLMVRVGIHEKSGRDLDFTSCCSKEFVDPKVRAMIELAKDKNGTLVMGVLFLERFINSMTPDSIVGMGIEPLGPIGLGRLLADLKAEGANKKAEKPSADKK
jgi:hypothetical protein